MKSFDTLAREAVVVHGEDGATAALFEQMIVALRAEDPLSDEDREVVNRMFMVTAMNDLARLLLPEDQVEQYEAMLAFSRIRVEYDYRYDQQAGEAG
jgi:hypothetical protein